MQESVKMELPELLVYFGGVQLTIQALFAFLGKIWINRIHEKDKAIYLRELEKIRHEFEANKNAIQTLSAAQVSNNSLIYQRRINSCETLWGDIIHIRSNIPAAIFIYDVLLNDELPSALDKSPQLQVKLKELNLGNFLERISDQNGDLELIRPFLSNKLWILYFTYRAFIARTIYLLAGHAQDNRLLPIQEDSGILKILGYAFDSKALEDFRGQQIGRVQFAERRLASMILTEIDVIIQNREGYSMNLEAYLETAKIVNELSNHGNKNKVTTR